MTEDFEIAGFSHGRADARTRLTSPAPLTLRPVLTAHTFRRPRERMQEPAPLAPNRADMDASQPRTYTISEAAEATGLTAKALRSRVDRGSIPAVQGRDGKRRIPHSELLRAGLIALQDSPAEAGAPQQPRAGHPVGLDVTALIDRLIAAESAQQIAGLLTQQADERAQNETARAQRLEDELNEARSRIAELEYASVRRRWFGTRRQKTAAT